jgi:hypothetical protein
MKKNILFMSCVIILLLSISSLYSQTSSRLDWYKNAVFNIHFGPCPSTFTEVKNSDYKDQIRELIRRVKPTMVQFHAGSQHGYTNYPSKCGITNPKLDGVDIIKVWREVTRECGVKFFAYMSYADSRAEGEAHPEFCQVDKDGNRLVSLCTNNPNPETYILPKTREIIENYDVDGFWFDASIWAVRPCYCKFCIEGFRKKYGKDPPKDNNDPMWSAFTEYQREAFEKTSKRVGDLIHQLKPSCIYSPNYAFTLYQPERVRDYVDVLTGDVGALRRAQMASIKCRFSDTQDVPWDIMISSHFSGWLSKGYFWLPKSIDYLNMENAIVRANGGITSVWTRPPRDASTSPYYVELLGQASDFIRERLDVFQDTEPLRDIGILHSASTFYKEGDGFCYMQPAIDRLEGAHIAYIKNNYHVNLFADYDLERRLKDYRIVVLSQQTYLPGDAVEAIRDFVKNGGKIITAGKIAMDQSSGHGSRSLLEDVLGIRFLDKEPMQMAYIPWNKLPIGIHCAWYPIETTTAESVLPMLKDWNQRNPVKLSYPAMTVNHYGEGTAVYIAGDLFTGYYHNQFHGIRSMIEKATMLADDNKPFETDAPVSVEFSLRKKDKDMIVHIINTSVDWDMDQRGAVHVENILPVGPFHMKLRCEEKPSDVVIKPCNTRLNWRWKNGYVWVTIPKIHIHEALIIENLF